MNQNEKKTFKKGEKTNLRNEVGGVMRQKGGGVMNRIC